MKYLLVAMLHDLRGVATKIPYPMRIASVMMN